MTKNFIDLFCGAGGLSLGFERAGFKCVGAIDISKACINTHKLNFPDCVSINKDISKINPREFSKEIRNKNIDLIIGGPPCPTFSTIGHAKIKSIKGKNNLNFTLFDDDRNFLFKNYFSYIEHFKPNFFIMENVPNFITKYQGSIFNQTKAKIEKLGYKILNEDNLVFNAADYGVPQTRKRVIFIAVRKDVTDAIGLTSLNIASVFPEKSSETVTCGNAFSDLVYDEEEIKMLTKSFTKGSHFETASKMPLDPKKVLTGCDYHPKGHHFNMKRISRFKPSPTITASGGCIHWSEMRKLALCETRRLTSLPEDFKLTGKWEQRSERMGRMVPPLMMKAIADSIYKKVLKPYKELNNG